jgi:hypothetical protein
MGLTTNERRTTTGNRRLAKKRVQCLNEALCFVSSSVLADSLVLRNPLLRQAPNRQDVKKLKLNAMRIEYFKKFQVAVRVF